MELNITRFWNEAAPRDYSASRAELGDDVGKVTWSHAVEDAPEYNFLDTDEKREEFRKYVKGFGAWSDEEIAAWSDTELNALLLQMISGDMRDVPEMSGPQDWDWTKYEQFCEQGVCSGRLYGGPMSTDGQIYYYIGD